MTDKVYYYIDINLLTRKIVDKGKSKTATLTSDTDDPKVHRVFLTPGQYNKFRKKLP